MHEINRKLNFEDRVKLARREIDRAWPLLTESGQESAMNDIVERYGLNTPWGHDALLQPLRDKIEEQDERIEELYKSPYLLPQRIKRNIRKWISNRKK